MHTPKSAITGTNRSTGNSTKRKLSRGENDAVNNPSQKQRTITDSFVPSRAGGKATSNSNKDDYPILDSRRHRREPSPRQESNLSPTSPPLYSPIVVNNMYSFPSANHKPGIGQASSSSPSARLGNVINRPSNFTPNTGAKKLIVKNLRPTSKLDQDQYFEKIWGQLNSALTAVFTNQKPVPSLEELYKGVENVCRLDKASILADRLRLRCESHIRDTVRVVLQQRVSGSSDVDFLKAVEAEWFDWTSRLVTLRSIFYYLDQSYLLRTANYDMIHDMGLNQFRSNIFSDESMKTKALAGTAELLDQDRRSESGLPDSTLQNMVKVFRDLGLYSNDFEPCFLDQSKNYLQSWAQKETGGYLGTYVERCHHLIEREMARCDLFSLDRNTRQEVVSMLDRSLVLDQKDVLLKENDELGLFRTNDLTSLRFLYSLLERQGLGWRLKPAFSHFIVDHGQSIVFDDQREQEMVPRLLEFKRNQDKIWRECFRRNEILGHTLRESFETFMNKPRKTTPGKIAENIKPGEMIAKYIDHLLKGGWRQFTGKMGELSTAEEDAEISRLLNEVLELFRFVHGKAVFEAFYKNDLARRLLMGRSASDEAEKSMLSKLRSECGSNFTYNLEAMFKDMDLAKEEMAQYSAHLPHDKSRIDFNVSVLSETAWPSYPDVTVNMPPEISKAVDNFQRFYKSKHQGRKLRWKHSLAFCKLRARFPRGNKEIAVSSFQALVLLLFNDVHDEETLSYTDIRTALGLPDIELKRTLQSLACAKYRVLTKQPKGRDVDETDRFGFNKNFHHEKVHIKINQIQLKETREENVAVHEQAAEDRVYETQAAIVRIMKARKVLTHSELVGEVIEKTRHRGVLEVGEIKRQIEKLMEREFIERTDDNKFAYVA